MAQSQTEQMNQMSTMLEQVKSQWAQQQKLMMQSNVQKNMIQNLMKQKAAPESKAMKPTKKTHKKHKKQARKTAKK